MSLREFDVIWLTLLWLVFLGTGFTGHWDVAAITFGSAWFFHVTSPRRP